MGEALDNNALMASVALLGLMFTIGAIVLIVQRDRRRASGQDKSVEERLSDWIEQQRAEGVDSEKIAERIDEKRAEFERRSG